ncbi:MAG TPA: hypothetical protein VH496_04420 [Mycobacterium sp.]
MAIANGHGNSRRTSLLPPSPPDNREDAAVDTGLATVLVSTTDDTAEVDDVAACERLHRRWRTAQKRAAA